MSWTAAASSAGAYNSEYHGTQMSIIHHLITDSLSIQSNEDDQGSQQMSDEQRRWSRVGRAVLVEQSGGSKVGEVDSRVVSERQSVSI